jgi:hypothetical protein
MRALKTVGTLLVVVFAVVAFAGATTASATRLCTTNTTPCTSVYANDRTFPMHLKPSTTITVTTSGGIINPTFTCAASTWGLTNSNQGGGVGVAVAVRLASVSYSACTSVNPAGCSSTFTVGLAGATGDVTSTAGMDGTLQLTPPLLGITCPILGTAVLCTYGGSGTLDGTVTGGNVATIDVRNQTIPASGGVGCPTSSVWNFTYTTTTALFVTAS